MKNRISLSVLLSFFVLCGCSLLVEVKDPPDDGVCGNSRIDGSEECDASDLGGKTCASLGQGSGQLGCTVDCTFDTSGCNPTKLCGNGSIDTGEDCEGGNLNGASCESLSLGGGTLACSDTCLFDTSRCEISSFCGNHIAEASEQCDDTDLNGETCESQGFTGGGTLRCAGDCGGYIFDNCINCSLSIFQECNPENNDCCPHNDKPSDCGEYFAMGALCVQQCTHYSDCGWSMDCLLEIDGHCFYSFCGPNAPNGFGINEICYFTDDRPGLCDVSMTVAGDGAGFCREFGSAPLGGPCVLGDHYTELGVDPSLHCSSGDCIQTGSANQGTCFEVCDPVGAYTLKQNTCSTGYCVNTSDIMRNTTDPRFLYRTPDRGICHQDPSTKVCDVFSGIGLYDNTPCLSSAPACSHLFLGSPIGLCREVSGAGLSEGQNCVLPMECGTGLGCTLKAPLQETDPLNSSNYACRKYCNPAGGETGNAACTGLQDDFGNSLICVSTSRFYTSDHQLVNGSYGSETSPSPLGFCVPPALQ